MFCPKGKLLSSWIHIHIEEEFRGVHSLLHGAGVPLLLEIGSSLAV